MKYFKTLYIIPGLIILSFIIILDACKKDPPPPTNPYSTINYNNGNQTQSPLDSASITGLHKNIFSTRCALPGCHDGHFEPDYRTVESTYYTLVWQPVNKTTVDNHHYFNYRVIPYDTANSFLHERVTTTTTAYMPSSGIRLSETEIQYINTWIMNGAPDAQGHLPVAPNLPPTISGFYATDSAFHEIDTNRVGGVIRNAFIAPANTTVYLFVIVSDDSTALPNLTVNQFKFSYNQTDFSAATTMNATYNTLAHLWCITFNTNMFTTGSTVYFRYDVNDGQHLSNTELPNDLSPSYYQTYASFYVSP